MTLIKNDETLRRFMPNVFATAKGETPLFDKLTPWLTASEQWLKEKICGEDTLAEIVALDDMNVVKMLASQIVVSDAVYSRNCPERGGTGKGRGLPRG